MTSEIELRFPSSIYYADPYAAIRSVLGNDVEIINFKESNVILPDSSILINVEYSAIDFDLFKLWKIEETKITSNSTQKIVATKLIDTITSKPLSDSIDKIVVISNYSENSKYKLIYIKYLDRINLLGNNANIKYYGFAPQTKSEVLHSYCSIIDTKFLSYHGNKLTAPSISNLDKSQYNQINVQNEIKALQKLSSNGIETNNFTNSNFDLSAIYNLIGDSKLESGQNSKIENSLNEIKLNEVSTKSGIINLNNLKPDEIKKALVGQKGILILSKFRDNIMSVVYLNTNQSNNIHITENIIDNLLLVINYDCYNLNLWNSQ